MKKNKPQIHQAFFVVTAILTRLDSALTCPNYSIRSYMQLQVSALTKQDLTRLGSFDQLVFRQLVSRIRVALDWLEQRSIYGIV